MVFYLVDTNLGGFDSTTYYFGCWPFCQPFGSNGTVCRFPELKICYVS